MQRMGDHFLRQACPGPGETAPLAQVTCPPEHGPAPQVRALTVSVRVSHKQQTSTADHLIITIVIFIISVMVVT